MIINDKMDEIRKEYIEKVYSLKTEQDIKQWREERKRNYPQIKHGHGVEKAKTRLDISKIIERKLSKYDYKYNQDHKKVEQQSRDNSGHHHQKTRTPRKQDKRPKYTKPNHTHNYKIPRKLSLYDQIFLKDVQKEEETILKCIKFIVDHNFEMPSDTSSPVCKQPQGMTDEEKK